MDDVALITSQTTDAYEWTNELLETIPLELWHTCPDIIESTLAWQTGHLILSHYFYAIMVINGHQKGLLEQLPMKDYDALYNTNSPTSTIDKHDPAVLFEHLKVVQASSLKLIGQLNSDELYKPLESLDKPHPIAKNKLEALDWNNKHTMYHCGQIGLLKRIVLERHNFRLGKQLKH
ncbi:DinB family protein [Marinoscillum pacificum]|uniref:DinB family protein n=1 Tax=Marinoscillum pacificum TaxID=392723 RepID=UPI00215895C6|nr:DinB family protein [Marinoscillum pacificum]